MNTQNVTTITPAAVKYPSLSQDFTVDSDTGEAFISQRKLAQLCGVPESTQRDWFKNNPRGYNCNKNNQLSHKSLGLFLKSAMLKGYEKAEPVLDQVLEAGAKAFIYDQAGFKMKAELKTPQTFLEAMQLATRALEALEAAKPAIKFHSEMFSTNARCSMNQFAKLLSDSSGVKIGQNKMMEFLRKSGYLMAGRDRNEHNRPYQKYMEAGWFEVDYVKTPVGMIPQTFITALGQTELSEHILAKFS